MVLMLESLSQKWIQEIDNERLSLSQDLNTVFHPPVGGGWTS